MLKPLHLGFFSIATATLTLASAFLIMDFFLGIGATVLIGISWTIFVWRKWTTGSILCMLFIVLGISLAVIYNGSQWVLLISILATLSAWDLANLHAKLSKNDNVSNANKLIRTHLLRLLSVLILGLTLPLMTFVMQFELKFWQVFLLGVLLLAGLSQIFIQLKRDNP